VTEQTRGRAGSHRRPDDTPHRDDHAQDRAASDGRDETPDERMDRNWNELLQELRVAQTGVQILTGFLLTVPFQQRFGDLDTFQTDVYLAFVALAVLSGWWVATQPDALALMGTPSQRQQYVDEAFASYYDPGIGFAGVVWTNNAWIAAVCIGIGISGIGPLFVLVQNAVSVGATGGMMAAHGSLDVFLTLIAPHGLLELTAIFVAGAAGLRLCWTWIAPGGRPRGRALAEEGRSLITVAIGLVGALALSGLVEGFVTGSTLAWWLKIVIGALALAAFWTYTIALGRRAAREGETGDLEEDAAGYAVAFAG